MKAILLAGGKGTRLQAAHRPHAETDRADLQSAVPPLPDRPVAAGARVDEVILSLNYQPRRIEEVLGEGEGLGLRVRYVVEPMPLGTGGAIRYAGDQLTESVIVFNGDVLTQVDVNAVLKLHRERKAKATIVLTPVENPRAYGLVETDSDGNIQRFLEKPGDNEITVNTINAGIYILEPDTFDRIPKDTAWSIERSYFPSLIERGETFVAYVDNGYWIDIGTPAKYLQCTATSWTAAMPLPRLPGWPHGAPWVAPDVKVEETWKSRAPASLTRVSSSRPAPACCPTRSSASRRTSKRAP